MMCSMAALASTERDALIAEGCNAAVALLRRNLSEAGILAATPSPRADARNYTRIFGRDAAICALGMAVSGERDLMEGAERGVVTLAQHQAASGQIPNYVAPTDEPDFWYVGSIDATLWWLIAVEWLSRQRPPLRESLAPQIRRALQWSLCQEHPRFGLVQQNEASDWADIMPRSGFVLYSNALWYYVKRIYGLPNQRQTRANFNQLFHPFSHALPADKRLRLLTHYIRNGCEGSELYLSFVNLSQWGEEGDLFGNLLAIAMGLADDGAAHRILHAITAHAAQQPVPLRAVCQPISQRSPLWRPYMNRHRQNGEFQYHNGGAWPFIGGFWVVALASQGRTTEARAALALVAHANQRNGWEFNEWFHGITGEPQGMAGQSWNAAMLLLARHALRTRIF